MGTCSVDEKEIEYVTDALKNTMLSTGKYLHKFEADMADWYGKDHAILVNSGQTAIEVALLAIRHRLKNGEIKVGVPILTYMATISSILVDGCFDPVFYDIDLDNYGVDYTRPGFDICGGGFDAKALDVAISVDLYGKECPVRRSTLGANTIVLEDACEAVMNPCCKYGEYIGLSFYASHILSCGSGGMVLLDDDEEADYIRSYIAHGRNHSGDFTKNTGKFMDRFVFTNYGQSLRSDNITAAIGCAQMEKGNRIINDRVIVSHRIADGLRALEEDRVLSLPCFRDNVFMFFPIVVHRKDFKVLEFMEYLWQNKIDSRRFMPVLSQPFFKECFSYIDPQNFPNALYCEERGIIVGCHQDLGDKEINHLVKTINEYFGYKVG